MTGKVRWAALAVLAISMGSGCRLCERWYEREHEPCHNRPYYYQPPGGGSCPPGCAPACPPGCAPAGGYGAGFIPPMNGGCG